MNAELLASIFAGSMLTALVLLAFALVSGVNWRRKVHYCRVWWKQMRAEDKQELGLWAACVVLFVNVLIVAAG